MNLTNEVKISLKREYALCSNAIGFCKKTLKEFEQKYHLSTQAFLKKPVIQKFIEDIEQTIASAPIILSSRIQK